MMLLVECYVRRQSAPVLHCHCAWMSRSVGNCIAGHPVNKTRLVPTRKPRIYEVLDVALTATSSPALNSSRSCVRRL